MRQLAQYLYDQQRESAATIAATILSCCSVFIFQNIGPVCNDDIQEFDLFWEETANRITPKTPMHLPFLSLCIRLHQ